MDRFCVNCRHCIDARSTNMLNYRCRPTASVDPVTGKQRDSSCDFARSFVGPCGPEGKLFEAKVVDADFAEVE